MRSELPLSCDSVGAGATPRDVTDTLDLVATECTLMCTCYSPSFGQETDFVLTLWVIEQFCEMSLTWWSSRVDQDMNILKTKCTMPHAGATLRDVTDTLDLVANERTLMCACLAERLLVQVMHKRMHLICMDAALAPDLGVPPHKTCHKAYCTENRTCDTDDCDNAA